MSEASKIIDRGALYYPFIHVRDESWLKATLLCFPFIDRMVPEDYEVNDGETAAFFAKNQGRLGRNMLGRRDLADPATEHARSELLEKLKEDLTARDLAIRFSREAAKGAYTDGENAFQIHEYKLGGALIEFLLSHHLAWTPANPVRGNANWWAVHPILGEAIMSTNAVALAKAHDLEIVTSDGPIHQALLGKTADGVYDMLVRQKVFGMPRPDTEKVNDLLRFVILSEFDNLENLSLTDIVELNRQRGDLAALKSALLAQVEDLGAMPDRETWNDVLSIRAKEVVEQWGARTSMRSMFSRAKMKDLTSEFQGALKTIAPHLLSGAFFTATVGALPGLAVGVVFSTVHMTMEWRASQQPYRFLSRLSRLSRKGERPRHLLECAPA